MCVCRNRERLPEGQSQLQCLSHIPAAHHSILPGFPDSAFCTRAQKTATEPPSWAAAARIWDHISTWYPYRKSPRWLTQLYLLTHRSIPHSGPSPPWQCLTLLKCSFLSSQLHMASEAGLPEPMQGCPSASWQQVWLQSVAMKTALQWSRHLPQTGALGAIGGPWPQHQTLFNASRQPAARGPASKGSSFKSLIWFLF